MAVINKFNIAVSDETATEATTAFPCLSPQLQASITSDASGNKVATPKAVRQYLTDQINSNNKLSILPSGDAPIGTDAYGECVKNIEFNETTGRLNINYKTIKPTSNRIKVIETSNTLEFNYINERTIETSSKIQGGSQFDETSITFEDEYHESDVAYTCAFMPSVMVDSDNKIKITHNLCSNGIAVDVYDNNGYKLLKSEYVANCIRLNSVELDLTDAESNHPFTGVWKIIVIADNKQSRREDYLKYYGRYNADAGTVTLVDGTSSSVSDAVSGITFGSSTTIYPYFTVNKRGKTCPDGTTAAKYIEVNDTIIITSKGPITYVKNDINWAPSTNTAYTKLFTTDDLIQSTLIVKHKLFKTRHAAISVIDDAQNIVDPSEYDILLISDDAAVIKFDTPTISGTWSITIFNNLYADLTGRLDWYSHSFNSSEAVANIMTLTMDFAGDNSDNAWLVNVYDANEKLIDIPTQIVIPNTLKLDISGQEDSDNFRVVAVDSKLNMEYPYKIFTEESYLGGLPADNVSTPSKMATLLFKYNDMAQNVIQFNHGLNSAKLIIEVYDTQRRKVLPSAIRIIDVNNIIVLMPALNQYSGVYTIVVLAHGSGTPYRVRSTTFAPGNKSGNTVTFNHGLNTTHLAVGLINISNFDYTECGYTCIDENNARFEVGEMSNGIMTIAGYHASDKICENATGKLIQYTCTGNDTLTNPFTGDYVTHANIINISLNSNEKILPTELVTGKDNIQIIYQNDSGSYSCFIIAMSNDGFYKEFTGWSTEFIPICANMHNHLDDFTHSADIADFIYTNWSYDIATAKIDTKFLSEIPSNLDGYSVSVGLYPNQPDYFGFFDMKDESILNPVIPTGDVELPNDYGAWTQITYQPQIETNQYAWFEDPATLRCYADKIKLQYSETYNDFTPIKLRMFYDKVTWAENLIIEEGYPLGKDEYDLNPSITKTFANDSIVTIEYSSYNHYVWELDLYDDPMTMFQVTSASLPHTYYGDKDNRVNVMIPAGASITVAKADGVYDSTGILKIRISYRTI